MDLFTVFVIGLVIGAAVGALAMLGAYRSLLRDQGTIEGARDDIAGLEILDSDFGRCGASTPGLHRCVLAQGHLDDHLWRIG